MALKSMKTTAADKKARQNEYKTMPGGTEDYPYGLRINLDSDSMKKLGLAKMPKAGTYVTVTAECCVSSTSVDERNGKANRRMELQIESMEVQMPKETMEDAIEQAFETDEDEE